MKLKYVLIFLSLTILIYNSCANEKNKNTISNKLIKFDNLESFNPFNINVKQHSSDYKYHIISYLNVSCSVCIAEIDKWNEFYKNINKNNFDIILVFYSEDKFEYIKFLFEKGDINKFPFPFYIDKKNIFLKYNPIFSEVSNDKTILIDNANKILNFGNPIHSNETKSLFIKTLTED